MFRKHFSADIGDNSEQVVVPHWLFCQVTKNTGFPFGGKHFKCGNDRTLMIACTTGYFFYQ
jgi:hypothetical protein